MRDFNGTEQWCPVQGGFCISEVSFNRGFTAHAYATAEQLIMVCHITHTACTSLSEGTYVCTYDKVEKS